IARDQDLSPAINSFFHGLLDSERYYWISSLYTLLMPSSRRKRLATYFTPPHLCEQVIDRLVEQGLDLEHHTVLDPAAGGAAFLVPLARRIQTIARARNSASADMISDIESRLSGIDVEPGLTELSHMLLSDLLGEELKALGRPLKQIIQRQNTLRSPADKLVDVVISNPPYGRIMRPSPRTLDRWKDVICEGHANLYALFIGAALERTKVGGLIGLIIPTSFLAGPYFRSLRNHIRSQATILSVDLIERRYDVFVDVIQDTCVVILRKTKESTNNRSKGTPSVGTIG
ncbi:N-6 DNA methylase, partial [Rhizobium ruizarguesonis]